MSTKVLDQVFDHSNARGTSRSVLVALADAAHHDGVTWIPQGPPSDPKSIAARANASVRSVERCVARLVEMGELKVRRVRQGRAWFNVYRVEMPGVWDVDYRRIPFAVDEPFETATGSTRQLDGPRIKGEPDTDGGSNQDAPPATSDDSTRQNVPRRPATSGGPRARVSSHPSDTHPSPGVGEVLHRHLGAPITSSEAKRRWRAVGELEASGVTTDELERLIAEYRRRWPTVALTDAAIARNAGLLRGLLTPDTDRPAPAPPCEECEVGGGYHSEGCTRATGRAA